MQSHANLLTNWTKLNHMALNPNKTKYMLITTRQKRQNIKKSFNPIIIDKTAIKEVNSHKLLGLTIDNNLSWANHITNICNQISKKVFVLSRIKHILNPQSRKLYFFAHIQSIIDYASTIWDNCSDINLKPLRSLHRRSLKLITSKKKIQPEDYHKTNILPLSKRLEFNKGLTMFKCLKSFAPEHLKNMFSSKNTRDQSKLYIPLPRIDLFKTSLKFSGAFLWNTLPLSIQNSISVYSFKRNYFSHLLKAPD